MILLWPWSLIKSTGSLLGLIDPKALGLFFWTAANLYGFCRHCSTLVLCELELLAAAKCWTLWMSERTEQSESTEQFTTAYFYLAEQWHLLLESGSLHTSWIKVLSASTWFSFPRWKIIPIKKFSGTINVLVNVVAIIPFILFHKKTPNNNVNGLEFSTLPSWDRNSWSLLGIPVELEMNWKETVLCWTSYYYNSN